MISKSPNFECHSADVRLELRLNGHILSISQLCPDFFVFANPINYPPTEAEIGMSIAGHESGWRVRPIKGLSTERRKSRIAPCSEFRS